MALMYGRICRPHAGYADHADRRPLTREGKGRETVGDDRFYLLSDAAFQLTRGGGVKLWRNGDPDRTAWFIRKIFSFLKMETQAAQSDHYR